MLISILIKLDWLKKNGAVTLSPISDKYEILEKSFGMFPDGTLSSERFIQEKAAEKELENRKE